MATAVIMPKVGISVESCVITKWHKQKGDAVKVGDLLFSYETDKASVDEEAKVDGTLLEIFQGDGADVPCLTNVAVIGNPGEDVSAFAPAADGDEAPAAEEAPKAAEAAAPAAEAAPLAPVERAEGEIIRISPRAKALAAKQNVDIRFAAGTGPYGRIIERDIKAVIDSGMTFTGAALGKDGAENATGTGIGGRVSLADLMAKPAPAAEAAPAAPVADYEDVKMSNVRKVISKSMLTSLTTTAQLTHNMSYDATEILKFRKNLKANAEKLGMGNITINDIIIYAVSRVLKNHKDLNANLIGGDTMRYFNHVHIGIAVDTERGLLVPTLRNADTLSLSEISAQAKALAKEAQAGNINPDKLQGASFTISNLGSFGVESFTPVINPPQTGILGVNTLTTRVREVNGELKAYQAMNLSLTYDHRALDGAPASKFLRELCTVLENFSIFLAK